MKQVKHQDPKTPPKYYTLIPAEVRYSKQISPGAKILYGEILTLASVNGYCNASNQYWASLFDVDDKTVSEWIRQLVSVEFIRSDILKDYQRKLYPKFGHIKEKNLTGVSGNPETTPSGKPDNNNTSNNTITNTTEDPSVVFNALSFFKEIQDKSSIPSDRLVAYFVIRKQLYKNCSTKKQALAMISRHSPVARRLKIFENAKIIKVMNTLDDLVARGKISQWGLEGVEKNLLGSKI
jgi:hypothetical protein